MNFRVVFLMCIAAFGLLAYHLYAVTAQMVCVCGPQDKREVKEDIKSEAACLELATCAWEQKISSLLVGARGGGYF